MSQERVYLPGLNGLRSVAVISVLSCHILYMNIGESILINWGIAHYAVTMFFVVSGFLITFLLLKERENQKKIDINKFYVRRILRIWPIYFLYISISIVSILIQKDINLFETPSILCYILLSGNFIYFFSTHGLQLLEHFWSIGVEEQFYLFWPWSFKFSKDNRSLLFIIVSIIFAYLTIKMIAYIFAKQESNIYMFIKQTRFDCMLIGAFGAVMYFQKNKIFFNIFSNKILQLISWLLYFLIGFNIIYFPVILAHEIIAVATLILIIGQIYKPLFSLEIKIFDFIGKISYGLYVIHPIVLYYLSKLFKGLILNEYLKWTLFVAISIFISIIIAWLSYKYFESYFLNFKKKYTVIKSSNIANYK